MFSQTQLRDLGGLRIRKIIRKGEVRVVNTGEGLAVDLTEAETLVLFDFLSRFERSGKLTIEHPAEEQALWNLLALIERELVAPFRQC